MLLCTHSEINQLIDIENKEGNEKGSRFNCIQYFRTMMIYNKCSKSLYFFALAYKLKCNFI